MDIYRENSSGFQQLHYAQQSATFFFLSLSREAMDKTYYDGMIKGSKTIVEREGKEVYHFIKDLELVLKTAYLHVDKEAFLNDIVKNKPIDERIYSFDLLQEENLSTIFRHKYSFNEPMDRLRSGGTATDMTIFLNYLSELNFNDSVKEYEEYEKEREELSETTLGDKIN